MGSHRRFSAVTREAFFFNVVLLLLSNAMLHVQGQVPPQMNCFVNCGLNLITCAMGCGGNPLCLIGCKATEFGCLGSCTTPVPPAPPVVPTIEVAGRGEAGIQMGTVKAVAVISSSSSGEDSLRGSLQFLQEDSTGVTHVKGRITGLTPGLHSLQIIHAPGGTIANGCIFTRPHFNPLTKVNEAPSRQIRHTLNLGNIIAGPDGIAVVSITGKHIPLNGPHSILNRALVVLANADDFGRGRNEPGITNGNVGAGVGCGIIRFQSSV